MYCDKVGIKVLQTKLFQKDYCLRTLQMRSILITYLNFIVYFNILYTYKFSRHVNFADDANSLFLGLYFQESPHQEIY